MKLYIRDRIALLGLLPQEGDFLTIKIVRELREALSFTEAEHAIFGITTLEDGRVSWQNDDGADIPIGPKAKGVIVKALEKADREKKLNEDCIGVYEMFMEDDE